MKRILIASMMLALATPAFTQQSLSERTGLNSLVGAAPTAQDFVAQAASSGMFEIRSSELAVQRADDATKPFAQQMITDHQKASAELKQLVDGGRVEAPLPAQMLAPDQQKIENLEPLQGAEFTARYHTEQVDAHQTAVDLFQRYADGGENPELKAWAAKTLPVLQHHLEMAQKLNQQ